MGAAKSTVSTGSTGSADEHRPRPLIVVMGVSGSGKTTVGEALAERLHLEYADADTFHPQSNIDKMATGHPLNDNDRAPWLAAIGAWLVQHDATGAVVSCSALRRRYRRTLLVAAPRCQFLHLRGSEAVIAERMRHRPEHFMKVDMLRSQLDTLEPLGDDEPGTVLDIDQPVSVLVDEATQRLRAEEPA